MDYKSFFRVQDEAVGNKAIGYDPRLVDAVGPEPLMLNSPARTRTPFSQREAARHLEAYGGTHDAIDWVMDCVRLIVETASNAEWHFEKEGEKYVTQRTPDTPAETKEAPMLLTKLFEEPNPYMGYEELIELTLIDYLLVGNAYWYKHRTNEAGQPLALYRLAPPFVKVIPDEFGIKSYRYDVPGRGELDLSPDQVCHFRQANPHSAYYGLGIIQGGSRMLDLELALTDTQASYYEKKAQPSMVVQSERRVPADVFKRLQRQLRQMYGGPKNAGSMMVLESGLKYQSISPSASEAAFENMTKLQRDRILAMFRVPGSLLGINDSTVSSGKVSDDQRVFDTKTMRPLLNKIQNAISKSVTEAWDGMDFVIEYEYLMPPEERVRLASSFAAVPGVRLREVREYVGLPPLGDERDEMVLNMPGEDGVKGDERRGFPDNNLEGEAGRPPNPENVRTFPANSSTRSGSAVVVRRTSLAAADNKAMSIEDIVAEFDSVAAGKKAMEPARLDFADRVQRPEDTLEVDRDTAVDGVVSQLSSELKDAIHTLERGLLDEAAKAIDGKAIGSRLRSKLRKSEAWNTFMSSITGALEKAARSAISTSVMQQGRLGNVPEEEIDYDALAREIVFRSGGVRKITANLKDEVAQKVAKALAEGQTRGDVEAAIRESMDFWRESHAETVALTEATHAYNEGTITVAELTGHDAVFVHDGRDDDEPCITADGQVWDLETARANRLEHPRCRRAFTPVKLNA